MQNIFLRVLHIIKLLFDEKLILKDHNRSYLQDKEIDEVDDSTDNLIKEEERFLFNQIEETVIELNNGNKGTVLLAVADEGYPKQVLDIIANLDSARLDNIACMCLSFISVVLRTI